MMPTEKKLSTSFSPKGFKFLAKCAAMYDKAQLSDEANGPAQNLNENPYFAAKLLQLITECSVSNRFTKEVISSNYTYPEEYKGPKFILDQIDMVEKQWGLDGSHARSFVVNIGKLPEGAEGWFAIPKLSAVVKKHLPATTESFVCYCEAVNLVLKKIVETRSFYNYRAGEIIPSKLRQHARTVNFMEKLEAEQPGDILIIAAQYGLRHRGESVRRARETFAGNEFGLGAFTLGCMALVHPERYVRWEELDTDCAGDEFSPDGDDAFSEAPRFGFRVGGLEFGASAVSSVYDDYCSASGFVLQG
jgi:hypothetical protein